MQKANKQKNFKAWVLFAVSCLALGLLAVPSALSQHRVGRFGTERVTYLANWECQHGNIIEPVVLPASVASQPGETVVFRTVLPRQLPDGASVCLRSSLSRVQIAAAGTLLYDSGSGGSGKLIGSRWNLVRLPVQAAGKTLEISLVSNHADRAGALNEAVLGSQSAILFDIVTHHGSGFVVGGLLLLLGLFLLPLHFLMDRKAFPRQEVIYLALFAIATSGWLLGESKMLQFFTGNETFTTLLPFLSLQIMPIPFVLYIESSGQLKKPWLTQIMFWAFVGSFVLCSTLHFTGTADFYTTLPLTHFLIVAAILVITATLLREAICRSNRSAVYLLLAQSVLFISGLIELWTFYQNDYNVTTISLQVGLLCYVVLLGGYSYSKVGMLLKKNQEARYLRSIAYQDLLTGGKNRTAYYEDIPKYFNSSGQTFSWLVLFDLNNLKSINDNYGHAAGDEALRSAFRCIEECFAPYGSCYRIGGDEFAAFLEGLSEQELEQTMQCFQEAVKQKNAQLPYEFKIAMGFGWYDHAIYENFESLSHEVDRRMYADKVKQKIAYATSTLEKVKKQAGYTASPQR